MTMIDPILMEFEQESATTRRVLSCVPTEKLDWRPHPKARSLGELATHIAVSQKAVTSAIQKPTHELLQLKETVPEKSEGIVAMFDDNISRIGESESAAGRPAAPRRRSCPRHRESMQAPRRTVALEERR